MHYLDRLEAVFNRARWVQFTDYGIFVWNGGHGLHLYNNNLREIDYYTVGDCGRNEATLDEVQEAIEDILSELLAEYADEPNE